MNDDERERLIDDLAAFLCRYPPFDKDPGRASRKAVRIVDSWLTEK